MATSMTSPLMTGLAGSAVVFLVGNALLVGAGLSFWRWGVGVWRLFGVALSAVAIVWVGGGIILGGCEASDCGVIEDMIHAGFAAAVAATIGLAVVGVVQEVRRRR